MLRPFLLLSLLLLLPLAAWPQAVGDVILDARFDGKDAAAPFDALPADVKIVEGRTGTKALFVERTETGSTSVRFKLPVEKLRGARIAFSAMVKAENVATPPNAWNGVKVMLHTSGPAGKQWNQQNSVWGTFDWKQVRATTRVPADAEEAWLILGLEATSGKVWFDDAKVQILSLPRKRPATPFNLDSVYKGHDLPRLRGTMIGMKMKDEDLRVLGQEWGANVVRWQLLWNGFPHSPADTVGVEEYDAWLNGELDYLESMLPVCEKYGLMVVIDLHTPPGGRDKEKNCRMFQEKRFQDHFGVVWDRIARRFKGKKIVWGYDLVNEPVEGTIPEGLKDWRAVALETARRVQAIDPDHALFIEPAPWGGPDALDNFEPLPLKNIVYSVHMYTPGEFTHQGVNNQKTGYTYPGEINGVKWDKERLRRVLQPVVDYQKDYGVHIFLGEFSAIRWAPGESARDYLRDVIDLFEEFGWDWTYHAYREWNGWSVEHGSDPNDNQRSATPTSRQLLLQSWFKKNVKPKL